MALDITTKEQAKSILKARGYPMIQDVEDFKKFADLFGVTDESERKRVEYVFRKRPSALITLVSPAEERALIFIFDETKKLVMFGAGERDRSRNFETVESKKIRNDFSFEISWKQDGTILHMIASPTLVERIAEAEFLK
jgi:hypothetical protein